MSKETDKIKALAKLEKSSEKQLLDEYKKARANIKSMLADLGQKGVLTQTEIYRYNRLQTVYNLVVGEMKTLSVSTGTVLEKSLIEQYKTSSQIQSFIIESSLGVDIGLTTVNTKAARAAIVNKLDNVGFIQRNKNNISDLANKINSTIAQGIIQGYGYGKIAKSIDERFNVGAYNALRLARTETHRCQEVAAFDSSQTASDIGVNIEKSWLSTVDGRTRDAHGAADGQTVAIDEAFDVMGEALMYPGDPAGSGPNVILCRCTTRNIVNGLKPGVRRIRGSKVVKYETYNQWLQHKKL